MIDVGAGTFPLPLKINPGGDIVISPMPMSVSATYLVHASQPANTKATSTRLVLDTLAVPVPVGTRVRLTATTVPGTAQYGVVCRSDNSGVGARLVLWVATDNFTAPYVCDVAVGTSIEILAFATTFECEDFTEIKGGYFYNTLDFTGANFTSVGGGSGSLVIFDGSEADYSNFSITPYIGAGEALMILPFLVEQLRVPQYASAELLGGACSAAAFFVRNYGGIVRCVGEMASIGAAIMFGASDGGSIQADGTVLRAFAGVGQFLSANDPSGTGGAAGLGGAFILGDCLEPRDLAGAIIAGSFTGAFLVNVGAQTSVKAAIGAASSITVGGILNPVAIAALAKSADVSGTRITGGTPTPGPAGPGYRAVAVTPSPLDPTTDQTLAAATSLGVPVIDIPLPDVTTLTPGARYTVNWEVGQGGGGQDVTVSPVGGQRVRNTLGAFSFTTAGVGSADLIASPATGNWLTA